jgi:hypothetical protein
MTVDGTDFRIQEPQPFSPTWYSSKFKGPGVRYEVGICIATGWIVWFHGPFKPGEYNDHAITQLALDSILDHGERYIADKGYHSTRALTPYDAWDHEDLHYMSTCRSRHETVNRLFKRFRSIGNRFRRHVTKHGLYAHSVACVVQLGIMFGEVQPYQIGVAEPVGWPRDSWIPIDVD